MAQFKVKGALCTVSSESLLALPFRVSHFSSCAVSLGAAVKRDDGGDVRYDCLADNN